jgi:phytol kinase
MVKPWLGVGLVTLLFAALMSGLRAARRARATDPEAIRKSLHVGMGLATLALPWLFVERWPVLFLATLFTLFLITLRVFAPLRRRFGGVIDGVARDSLGDVGFPVAVGCVFLLSDGDRLLFCIPMLILALADAAAALVGTRYGRLRYVTPDGHKSIEGSLAFLVVAHLSAHTPLVLFTDIGGRESLVIALTLALFVTLLEAVAWRGLDNLFVPLGAFVLLKALLRWELIALEASLALALLLVTSSLMLCRPRSTAGGVGSAHHAAFRPELGSPAGGLRR